MPHMRIRDYTLIVLVAGLLTLPSLGSHALWDMDEGVNAGCAREMYEAGTWIVPTFNWELRSAKPVLLYWLQRFSFYGWGVSEFAARLPSALLGLFSCLLIYELARRMFDSLTGLLAAIVLISAIQFNLLSHAATPDAPLMFFVIATFAWVWYLQEDQGRNWLIWPALPCGLAVLAKGPVGLGLPGLALVLYFLWNREGKRLFDHRLGYGVWLFAAVVVPWVAFVAAETRGEWVSKFLLNENVNRVATAQENHSGPIFYYLVCLLVLFAPWSTIIGGTFWFAVKQSQATPLESRSTDDAKRSERLLRANRFLLTWIVAFLVPFSLFATKLPNYIGPVYPPLAILTARFLLAWYRQEVTVPRWFWWAAVAGLIVTGLAFLLGFILASGRVDLGIKNFRSFPGLEWWAWVGLFPLVAAGVVAWGVRQDRRAAVLLAYVVAACGLVGCVAAGAVLVVDQYKAAKYLVLQSGAKQPEAEIRLGTLQYFSDNQSIVFYAERRVEVLPDVAAAKRFLSIPLESYLFVPESIWESEFAGYPGRVVARKYDFIKNRVIVVVCNR